LERNLDNQVITTIISTGGAVIVGLGGMWISANQTGKRIDDLRADLNKRIDELKADFASACMPSKPI
jgi:hypothetical protein